MPGFQRVVHTVLPWEQKRVVKVADAGRHEIACVFFGGAREQGTEVSCVFALFQAAPPSWAFRAALLHRRGRFPFVELGKENALVVKAVAQKGEIVLHCLDQPSIKYSLSLTQRK